MLTKVSNGVKDYYSQQTHTFFEDVQAIVCGIIMLALGLVIIKSAGLFVGGIVGISLVSHYVTAWDFGVIFFVLNIPFYFLAYYRFGGVFVAKTLTSVFLLSWLADALPSWIVIESINVYVAAICGGILTGVGMIIVFRHCSSVGGINILVLYLQDKFNISAGVFQLIIDLIIVLSAAIFLPTHLIMPSILAGLIMNLTIIINHKKGRYVSF